MNDKSLKISGPHLSLSEAHARLAASGLPRNQAGKLMKQTLRRTFES